MLKLRLILVRHSENQMNKEGRIQGINDVPISRTSWAQAHALAKALGADMPFWLYTSPLSRAMETTQIISETLTVSLKELGEANAGVLEGLSDLEMRQHHPEFAKRWAQDNSTVQMPGGESLPQVQKRAWRAVNLLTGKHRDDTPVAVTHNFTIQTIVCSVLDMPLNNALRLRPTLGSITRLELCGSKRWLLSLNERGHLQSLTPTEHGPFPR